VRSTPNTILEAMFGSTVLDLSIQERLDLLDKNGLIAWPPTGKTPRLKFYSFRERYAPERVVKAVFDEFFAKPSATSVTLGTK